MRLGDVQAENGPTRHVIAGGPVLIDTIGTPIVSDRVKEELALIDPALKIEFLESAWGMSGFVLKKQWGPNDPRWETVQRGETPRDKAFDVEHRFPSDCRTDDMIAYIRNRWGERNIPKDPRAEADRLIAEAMKLRAQADAEAVDQLVEVSTRKALDDTNHQRELVAEEAYGGTHATAHPMIVNDGPKRLL